MSTIPVWKDCIFQISAGGIAGFEIIFTQIYSINIKQHKN